MAIVGYIYILTNPSFENFVKIGYADDVEERINQLNRSECTPFAFRLYATYAVEERLLDKKVHELIDTINDSLRSSETVSGKSRVREFFQMSPEDAYSILACIASITGTSDRLELKPKDEEALEDEREAKLVEEFSRKRNENFSFAKAQIPPGSVIHYIYDDSIIARVIDDRKIEFRGQKTSLTQAIRLIQGNSSITRGPQYWSYNGMSLLDLRRKLRKEGKYIDSKTKCVCDDESHE